MINNPWEEIGYGAQRRASIDKNIYWVKETKGDYGICIEINNESAIKIGDIDLKDIDIVRSERDFQRILQWYLILRNREEWQIFKVLCDDLIEVSSSAKTEKSMISLMESRLKRWQNLLKKSRDLNFPIEKQMGLYSELYCLKNTIAKKVGLTKAIDCWVGPEADKQDFLLDNAAVEVKSYRTSKGEKVEITSKEQLQTEKNNLFLLTFALTKSDNGYSIEDILEEIRLTLINEGELGKIDLLEFKAAEYGYIPILHKEKLLSTFIVDNVNAYQVIDKFPRIISNNISPEITTVKYQIDLALCQEWKISIDDLNL